MLPQKSLEKNKQQKYILNSPKLSVGMFSNQPSLISQLISTKIKAKQQQLSISRTTCEFRAVTPISPPKSGPYSHKFNYNSLSQLSRVNSNGNLDNIQQEFNKQDETIHEQGDVSIRLRNNEEDVLQKVQKNLKLIGEQIYKKKSNQINSFLLLSWQKQLNQNCEKLIKALSLQLNSSQNFYKPSQHRESIIQLQKQLNEEKKNRLLVEEQTSKIIQSQEQQIKQYIMNIQLLEKELSLQQ
ncbi:unnamed protein product [Paramecium sonneborni]|uniref:Uncharacterized protein n=1 Tax=Paramecium sonneborni TaxID=65129 RepID=A0A8S1N875_9CILI|nr:unnamed protein product [Paramecium sonneborni]CAD8088242.1 unnamed protein product [Paramecium sonneborni]